MQHKAIARLLPAALVVAPSLAMAHGDLPHGAFVDGFAHPFTGLDHLLAMIAVGLLAGRASARQAWLVPLAFVVTMIAGALVGLTSIELPTAEIVIAASVIAFGFAVAARDTLGLSAATVLVASFALFHGYAHGMEARSDGSFAAYVAGFALATASLHALGVGIALACRDASFRKERVLRQLGRAAMIAGVILAIRLVLRAGPRTAGEIMHVQVLDFESARKSHPVSA